MHRVRSHGRIPVLVMALVLGAASGCNTLAGIEEGVLDSPPCAPSDPDCSGEPESSAVPCPDCTLGCLPPWQLEDPATGHCYLAERNREKPWDLAGDACIKLGGTLAALTSADELDLVRPLVHESTWIGGSDLAARDTYEWSNGEPWWPMAPWASGRADSEGGKDCVKLSPEPPIAFDNARCSVKLAYLCEKP